MAIVEVRNATLVEGGIAPRIDPHESTCDRDMSCIRDSPDYGNPGIPGVDHDPLVFASADQEERTRQGAQSQPAGSESEP